MEVTDIIKGNWDTRRVTIGSKELKPDKSQKLRNHSPDGFNWGYGGSGPAQFALGLLLAFSDKQFALNNYQDFKWDVIARLPQDDFSIFASVVINWIKERKKQNGSD